MNIHEKINIKSYFGLHTYDYRMRASTSDFLHWLSNRRGRTEMPYQNSKLFSNYTKRESFEFKF